MKGPGGNSTSLSFLLPPSKESPDLITSRPLSTLLSPNSSSLVTVAFQLLFPLQLTQECNKCVDGGTIGDLNDIICGISSLSVFRKMNVPILSIKLILISVVTELQSTSGLYLWMVLFKQDVLNHISKSFPL